MIYLAFLPIAVFGQDSIQLTFDPVVIQGMGCFTPQEGIQLLRLRNKAISCDSLISERDGRIFELSRQKEAKEQIIANQEKIIHNDGILLAEEQNKVLILQGAILPMEKKIKRQERIIRVLGAVSLGLAAALIL